MNASSNTANSQQYRSDASREQLGRCCAIDLAADTLERLCRPGHRRIERRRQVVGQHFGGHIDQQGVLAQPADICQPQTVFQALERLLDAPAPVMHIGRLGHRGHVLAQRGHQDPGVPAGADVANQASMYGRGSIKLPRNRLLRTAGREPAPALALTAAQGAARSSPALGLVATDREVNSAPGQGLHQPGGLIAPIQDQHIAAAQPIELVKEHLALALGFGPDGQVRHQITARQVQAKGVLNRGNQRACAQAGALGGRQHSAISTDQAAALEQVLLVLVFNGIDQVVIECSQGGRMQLGAGLGQGAIETRTPVLLVPMLAKKVSSSLCTLLPRKLRKAANSVSRGSLREWVKVGRT